MSRPLSVRQGLPALALGTLLVICTLPPTAWLVRSQVQAQFNPIPGTPGTERWLPQNTIVQPTSDEATEMQRLRVEAARHRGDYAIQVAAAIQAPPDGSGGVGTRRVRALQALIPRFGDHPALFAHIVRFETQGQVLVRRPEEYMLTGTQHPPGPAARRSSPSDLAVFDRCAAAGERLDPDNAYFPLMRAAGFFAARRDADAISAIELAGEKPIWNDYTADEADATTQLYNAAFGRVSAISRAALDDGLLLPHLSQCRAAARMAAYSAMCMQMEGQRGTGLALRMAVIRCGSLMRVQSTTAIGSLVGIALTHVAGGRPGGAPAIHPDAAAIGQQRADRSDARFLGYLRAEGYPAEAQVVKAEYAAGRQAREILHQSIDGKSFGAPLSRLITCWIIDLALLSNGLWLLILGGVASLRWRRTAGPAPVLGIAALCGMIIGLVSQTTWAATFGTLLFLRSDIPLWEGSGDGFVSAAPAHGWCLLVSLVVPLTLVVGMALAALLRREGLSIGLTRRLQTTGISVACVLLILYGAMVAATLHYEAAASWSEDQMIRRGGSYEASLVEQQWPGPTRWELQGSSSQQ